MKAALLQPKPLVEETPSLPSIDVSASPLPLVVGEEFVVATATVEEDPPPQVPIADTSAPTVITIDENFVATAALYEDAPPLQPLSVDLFVTLTTSEDFAGSLPLDETSPATWPQTPNSFALAPNDDDFTAPKLTEDTTTVFVVSLDAPVAFAPQNEDFAGSLPLEEASIWIAVPPSPVWITAPIDEEFGGAHPTEDSLPAFVVAADPSPTLAPSSEDFVQQQTAFDESNIFTLTFVELPFLQTPTPEDFAGSLPFEDTSPFVPGAPLVWLSYSVNSEDFTSPKLDEDPVLLRLVVSAEVVTSPPTFEDFAGSLPLEEFNPLPLLFDQPPIVVQPVDESFTSPKLDEDTPVVWRISGVDFIASIPNEEQFAGSLPFEDSTIVFSIGQNETSSTSPQNEDFAGSLPLEESSPFVRIDVSVSLPTVVVDEDFTSPKLDEDPAALPSLVPESVWLAPIVASEDFISPHFDETPAEVTPFVDPWSNLPPPFVVDEDFAGSLPLENEPPTFAVLARSRVFFVFVDGEVIPVQPKPPPPPPPPFVERLPIRLPERQIPLGGDSGANLILWRPTPPVIREWPSDIVVTHPKPKSDYALLPLAGESVVVALSDGVVDVFRDEKGGLVVRLTADDGTTFYYAKVKNPKTGRVRKDEPIGVTEAASAPKALPPKPTETTTEQTVEESPKPPPAVFGVLPVQTIEPPPAPLPPQKADPLALPSHLELRKLEDGTAHSPLAPVPKPSIGEQILRGIAIVGTAIGVAWIIRALKNPPPKKPTKRKRRRRRRR